MMQYKVSVDQIINCGIKIMFINYFIPHITYAGAVFFKFVV